MEKSGEDKHTAWLISGSLFTIIGTFSTTPPLQNVIHSFLDPDNAALASIVLFVTGMICFITYLYKRFV